MTRTLIFGTSYVATPERRDLTILWAKLVAKLNPGADILLVDSASPFDPCVFLQPMKWARVPHLQGFPLVYDNVTGMVHRFDDNIGHLGGGGKDGWGRAFCWGLDYAIGQGYDRIAYMDSDILFAKPVEPIFRKMERCGVAVAMPWEPYYGWPENGIVFMAADYMAKTEFTKRYDWQNSPQNPLPERRCELLLEDELFILPLRGCRNDFNLVTPQNIRQAFVFGCDWITHCRDPQVYQAFLQINGLEV